MNYDTVGNVQCNATDNYSFNVGEVVLDIEKNSNVYDESNMYSEQVHFDNSSVNSEQVHYGDSQSFVDNSYSFVDNSRETNSRVSSAAPAQNGVTVNFNAFNEIHSPSTDVDSVMVQFGEKLAEAVALAAEGIHL
jgi:hypothetical protein